MPRRLDEQPIPYEAARSLYARRALEAAKNAKLLARLVLEENAPRFERPARAADAADERTLRGLPAVGRNVSGAITGTRPESEAVRRDEQRRRRRDA